MKIAPHLTVLALVAALPLLALPAHADLANNAQRLLKASGTTTSDSSVITSAAQANTGSLVSMVSSGLGITEQQSTGGLGALFNVAKSQLSGDDFSQIAGAVPEMNELLAAAPATESKGGGLLAKAGSLGKSLDTANQLKGSFDQLGLSADMIAPMANIAAQYLETSSPTAAALLKQVVGGQ